MSDTGIGENIRRIISKKKMIQAAVARDAGYDPKKFNDMLMGRAKIYDHDIVPICKSLMVTPNELFGYPTDQN